MAVPLREQGGCAGALVHPEIASVILLLCHRKTLFLQRLLEAEEMRRFVVGNHAVEIEDDGSEHSDADGRMAPTLPNGQGCDRRRSLVPSLCWSILRPEPVKREA